MAKRAVLKAVSSFLPAGKLTNDQLAREFNDLDADQILSKTGVAIRSVAGADECASDLGVAAAEKLFAAEKYRRDDIDFLFFCTQSPDYFLPTTACLVQDRLGLNTTCGAIDINQGCSGYVYGLVLAKSLIEAGTANNVLLITADTYTKFINKLDRTVRTLFGDGAAATLVSVEETDSEMIGPFVLGSDGRGAQNLIVKAGGLRCRPTPQTASETVDKCGNWRAENNLYMNGAELFNFALSTVPGATQELLLKSNMTMDNVDLVILHQANKFMLERLRAKMKIPEAKFWIDMENTGNTVSSTIPIALETALKQGRVRSGDRVTLIGFGVGYSWGAAMIEIG